MTRELVELLQFAIEMCGWTREMIESLSADDVNDGADMNITAEELEIAKSKLIW